MTVLLFLSGLIVGGLIGIATMCIVTVARQADEHIEWGVFSGQNADAVLPEQVSQNDKDTQKE